LTLSARFSSRRNLLDFLLQPVAIALDLHRRIYREAEVSATFQFRDQGFSGP